MRKFETDRELIEGCLKNNRACQKSIYDRFSSKMLGVCMRYTNSREEAEDILIEGFMKFYTSLSSYRYECSLENWIRRIMINNAISHYRVNERKTHLYLEDLYVETDVYHSENILDKVAAKDIMVLIQKMPPGYRVIFNLFAVEGYSHKEIAEQLDITESTSKSQFLRARKWLIKRIEK